MIRKIFLLVTVLLLTSCAAYVDRMHKELDRGQEQSVRARYKRDYDAFAQFRQGREYEGYRPRYDRRRQQMRTLSSREKSRVYPKVKRQYSKKRITARDLEDNKAQGSLWAGSGNENYLFTKNKWKKNGDIVLVNVQKKLKTEITLELKRAFPDFPKKKKKKDGDAGKAPASEQSAQAAPGPGAGEESLGGDETKVHDRISSVIIEEISKDHLLIRGQKLLLYKNRKRLIEVQALVSRRDISDDDTINSSKFLESSITVIR